MEKGGHVMGLRKLLFHKEMLPSFNRRITLQESFSQKTLKCELVRRNVGQNTKQAKRLLEVKFVHVYELC
jgi:hypothetical protein